MAVANKIERLMRELMGVLILEGPSCEVGYSLQFKGRWRFELWESDILQSWFCEKVVGAFLLLNPSPYGIILY